MTKLCSFCGQNRNKSLKKLKKPIFDMLKEWRQLTNIHSVCYLCHEGLTVAFNFKCKCEQSIGYHCNNQQIYSEGEISIESLTDEEDFAGFEPMSSDLNCNKPKEKMSNEIKAFVCGICQRSYKTKGCLESHIIRHQTKSGQLHCSRCSSRFLVHPHYKSHACI